MPNIIEEDKIVFKAPKTIIYSLTIAPLLYLALLVVFYFMGYLGTSADLVFTLALVTVLIAVPFAYKIIFNPPTITRDGVKGLGFSTHQYSWSEISAVKVCKQPGNNNNSSDALVWGAMFFLVEGKKRFCPFPEDKEWPEFIEKVNEFSGSTLCSEDAELTEHN